MRPSDSHSRPATRLTACIVAVAAATYLTAPSDAGLISSVGVLPGDVGSHAYNINASGTAVGYSYGPPDGSFNIEGVEHAFAYTSAAGMTALGNLGGTWSAAASVNDTGSVVGVAVYAPSSGHAFLYQPPGPMQDIGSLPSTNDINIAYDVNDAGVVVGSSGHAFRYVGAGPMQDLGVLPGGTYSIAYAVNASGAIVGSSDVSPSGDTRAFRFTGAGPMQDLGTLPSYYTSGSAANDINSNGAIVGYAYNGIPTYSDNRRAFLYTPAGVMQNLGALGVFGPTPGGSSEAIGINDAGYVVGTSASSSGDHAVLWTPANSLLDLDLWLDQHSPAEGSHWTLVTARAINANGLIVGDGLLDGSPRGFILDASTLVPEPSVGLALSLAVLLPRARRRRA